MIFWFESAKSDRRSRYAYIAMDSPQAAERIEDEIDRRTDMFDQFPTLGRKGRVPGTRELVINRSPFVLIFRVRKARIEILRILHGAQRWP